MAASVATPYVGRFAPSPTGPLHQGSLVTALASWLDARAHGGQWLIRIEDVDRPRCPPAMTAVVLQQLARIGLYSDGEILHQSQRSACYQAALDRLIAEGRAYGCACTRQRIAVHWHQLGEPEVAGVERPYPGWCRHRPPAPEQVRAWRLALPVGPDATVDWFDRQLGVQRQAVDQVTGDVVLRRADGLFAYQLAVVVDDAEQGVTDIVRGEDLADNTARQILLQQALGLPLPRYLHMPLVLAADGRKLSKQNGATAFDAEISGPPWAALAHAATTLSLWRSAETAEHTARGEQEHAQPLSDWLQAAVAEWSSVSPPVTGAATPSDARSLA
jgi:glutamyl-Q tRNA(Asp) synthetase